MPPAPARHTAKSGDPTQRLSSLPRTLSHTRPMQSHPPTNGIQGCRGAAGMGVQVKCGASGSQDLPSRWFCHVRCHLNRHALRLAGHVVPLVLRV